MKLRFFIVLTLYFISIVQTYAEEITVAVASNFSAAMKDVVAEFEKESNHKVKLVFGSSGKFYAQIKNGAPFHIFFSADQVKPLALEEDGLIVANSRFTYVIGALALWSENADVVDDAGQVLQQNSFNKLAVANFKLAPYGIAALEVLESLNLLEILRGKLVQGENIAQTYQFVDTGNAELGFVALSQIMHKESINKGSFWLVPSALYSPIRQDVVLLNRGESSPAARELLDFVRSDKVIELLESYGYRSEL